MKKNNKTKNSLFCIWSLSTIQKKNTECSLTASSTEVNTTTSVTVASLPVRLKIVDHWYFRVWYISSQVYLLSYLPSDISAWGFASIVLFTYLPHCRSTFSPVSLPVSVLLSTTFSHGCLPHDQSLNQCLLTCLPFNLCVMSAFLYFTCLWKYLSGTLEYQQ